MNISSSIISGIGISLGGMNTAIDFLYANAEIYEPELNEIKSITIDTDDLFSENDTLKKVVINKPIKPKISKDGIIKKYSLHIIEDTRKSNEEVIDVGFITETEDFDFSFDDLTPEISEVDEEANNLLLRLNMAGQELSLGGLNETDESDEDILEDIIDDIEEDSEFTEEDNDAMSDTQENLVLNSDEDELNIDFEEDDLEDIDELDESDDISLDDIDALDIDEDDESEEDDIDLEDIDDIDFDDNDDNFLDDENEQNDGNEDIDDIDIDIDTLDDDIDVELDDDFKEDDIQCNNASINNNVKETNSNLVSNDTDTNTIKDKEIEQLKQQLAAAQKMAQNVQNEKASNNTSNLYDDKVKNDTDDVDKLIESAKGASHTPKYTVDDRYEKYNNMPADVLINEVRKYMISLGVKRNLVDITPLYEKFGESNIKKLIHKSYLIRTGKGVTIGL